MQYDYKNKTINVSKDSADTLLGIGGFVLDTLPEFINSTNYQNKSDYLQDVDDWNTIKKWLNCGEDITDVQREKWERTCLSYFATQEAPSFALEDTFKFTKENSKENNWNLVDLNDEIIDVLNRLFATKKEIQEKKYFINTPDKNSNENNPENNFAGEFKFSKKQKLIAAICAFWLFYVYLRTDSDQEFLGIGFERWDRDSFWLNLLLPPILIFTIFQLSKWLKKEEVEN